jgi:hypothetical protein
MPDGKSEIIFSVSSLADLALRSYFLDDKQRQHILLGHRGLQTAIGAIQSAVEGPTQIYRSKSDDNRLVFISEKVTTGKGRPMKVVIERVGDEGKIITATWSSGGGGQLVWDSSGTLYSNYDEPHDVFYLSRGSAKPEYAEDDPKYPDVWLRKNEEDDVAQGVTIFGLKNRSPEDIDELYQHVALFLGVTKDEVGLRINPLLGSEKRA